MMKFMKSVKRDILCCNSWKINKMLMALMAPKRQYSAEKFKDFLLKPVLQSDII